MGGGERRVPRKHLVEHAPQGIEVTPGIDLLISSTGRHRHLARMESHVSSLDTLSSQGSDRGQVLRQSHSDDHLGQFPGRLHTQDLDRGLGRWVHARRAML